MIFNSPDTQKCTLSEAHHIILTDDPPQNQVAQYKVHIGHQDQIELTSDQLFHFISGRMNAIHHCYINYSYYAKKNYDKIFLNLKGYEIENTVVIFNYIFILIVPYQDFFCDNNLTIIFFSIVIVYSMRLPLCLIHLLDEMYLSCVGYITLTCSTHFQLINECVNNRKITDTIKNHHLAGRKLHITMY